MPPKKKTTPKKPAAAKKPAGKKQIKELSQEDHLTILADDIARFNKGEVMKTKVYDETSVLVILLKDGRKFKVNFNRDDPRPVL